eukprot:200775-Chlamydomonas_euryale.AAC.2
MAVTTPTASMRNTSTEAASSLRTAGTASQARRRTHAWQAVPTALCRPRPWPQSQPRQPMNMRMTHVQAVAQPNAVRVSTYARAQRCQLLKRRHRVTAQRNSTAAYPLETDVITASESATESYCGIPSGN